jgi:hypothetical protein
VFSVIKPPTLLRRAWNFRAGDALNSFGMWGYHDSYAMHLRLGVYTVAPKCIQFP